METSLIYGKSKSKRWDFSHHVIPPMSSSATYRLGSAERGAKGFLAYGKDEEDGKAPIYIYDRLDEPNKGMLEENLARAESGDICLTFATGMAAISAALGCTTKSGDEIICHKTLYGCTNSLLTNWYPRYNINVKFVDMRFINDFAGHISPRTRAVYYETPANPTMELIDIARVSDVIKQANKKRKEEHKIVSIVDNTFATPFCQRPLELGADFSVHSLTKNIGGFGTDMGGAVITKHKWFLQLLLYRKDFGGVLAPKSAWPVLVYGLPTLILRIKQQQENTGKIAEFLQSHPIVDKVLYPGLPSHPQYEIARKQMVDYDGNFAPGIMLYFQIKGTQKKSEQACKKIENYIAKNAYSITLAVSLGQLRTLIESPTSMTHAVLSVKDKHRSGILGSGLRISAGIEDPKDVIADLKKAFEHAR